MKLIFGLLKYLYPRFVWEIKTEEKPGVEEKPVKKIDFEITNTDDVDIDDKGQLGLF